MAKTVFRFESRPTFRDIEGRFARANKQLLEDRRAAMRSLGRLMKDYMQQEAPKRTGEFAGNIRFRTFASGNVLGFTASTPQPLGKWIIEGTRPHPIVGNPYLAFFWERIGKFMVVHSVNHPGTQPNDFVTRAFNRWEPQAQGELRRISTRWVRTVAG